MWFRRGHNWKVKVIGKNKWHHRVPWLQKHRSRHQNRHPTCFSSKVMVKNVCLHNDGQGNAFACVTRSNRSRYLLIRWKALTQAILYSNLGTLCALYGSKSDFTKVMTLIVQGQRLKQNDTIGFLELRNIDLDTKIIILSVLVQKLRSKAYFCIVVANVTHSRTSHVQTAQDFFKFIERPLPKLPSVNIWWQVVLEQVRYGPKCDFIVTLKSQGHPWRSTVFYQTPVTYP